MANPILNENTFANENYTQYEMLDVMTKNGVITKTAILFVIMLIASAMSWYKAITTPASATLMMMIGAFGGFITAIVLAFKRDLAGYLAPLYALLEGLFVGAMSCFFEAEFPGIVYQAVLGTFAVLFTVLALYASRVIVVTDKLRGVIFSATLAIGLVYLIAIVCSFFGFQIPFLHQPNLIGIGISIFIIIVAASNFLIDFDNIERGINAMAPKYYEWFCSFGVLVTLVWVYLEILRLLAMFARRR